MFHVKLNDVAVQHHQYSTMFHVKHLVGSSLTDAKLAKYLP